ncbi:inorganic diphosphatase [soil metagenome]
MKAMHNLLELPPGANAPHSVNAIIEVPKGSANKYEYDDKLGVFRLDRVLYSPMHYPGNYGFVPSTLAEDGDPVDILVLNDQPIYPGTLLEARPIGFLEMSDEKGRDQKVLAVSIGDPRYQEYMSIKDVTSHRLREIEHFFEIYKELEGKETVVEGWHDVEDAKAIIMDGIEAFRKPETSLSR